MGEDMNTVKCLLCILLLASSISTCFAKPKNWDTANPSVQHLQDLTVKGKEVRENDLPLEKVDMTEDMIQVKEIKEVYYKKYNLYQQENIKKIPD